MKKILLVLLIGLVNYSNAQVLVMPGDFPDPSVVKIGDTYWASATTSNWAPAFPLLQSKDLIHWETKGHVFKKLPAWADYYFWAPEITYENKKVYMYYAAHKRDGNLCIAVASADSPEGPYTDHGPLMCEKAGSIDAFPFRDNSGKLFMIWKEDGNSVKQPTPIWAMEMNESRTALVGEKFELFRNDADWEANLVEGVSMIRHGDYIYAFYAGAGCCGRECSYASGVARAKDLRGPWEKYDKNPLLTSNETWKCPGHGTPVEKDGRYYFLYHAYHADGGVYTGRQGVLKEFKFTADGWVDFVDDAMESVKPQKISDDFSGKALHPEWQWSVFQPVKYKIRKGVIQLMTESPDHTSFIGRKTLSGNYTAIVSVMRKMSDAAGGLAIVGDDRNLIGVRIENDKVLVVKIQDDKTEVMYETRIPSSDRIQLKIEVKQGDQFFFSYGDTAGKFNELNVDAIDGAYLPPWDRALRVSLTAYGSSGQKAVFDDFSVIESSAKK